MTDRTELKPLQLGDFLVLSMGKSGVVPFHVLASKASELIYDPVKQGVLAGPMVGQGATPSASQAAAFVDNILFALSASATSINGVTDIFQIQKDFEILQFWYGIAPRHIRAWIKQPYSSFTTVLDNNIIPSSNYPDVGFVDGFDSPFNQPAPVSENFSLKNLSLNWTLENPTLGSATAPMTWNPRFNFYINRIAVEPVKEAATVKALLLGRQYANRHTIGDPMGTVPYDAEAYGGATPIPLSYALRSDFETVLKKAGYV